MQTNLTGKLIWAGNLTVNGEEITGVAIEIAPDDLTGKPLPMYQPVSVMAGMHGFSRKEMESKLRDWMVAEFGHPRDCLTEPEAKDRWYRDCGLILHFISDAFEDAKVANPKDSAH